MKRKPISSKSLACTCPSLEELRADVSQLKATQNRLLGALSLAAFLVPLAVRWLVK